MRLLPRLTWFCIVFSIALGGARGAEPKAGWFDEFAKLVQTPAEVGEGRPLYVIKGEPGKPVAFEMPLDADKSADLRIGMHSGRRVSWLLLKDLAVIDADGTKVPIKAGGDKTHPLGKSVVEWVGYKGTVNGKPTELHFKPRPAGYLRFRLKGTEKAITGTVSCQRCKGETSADLIGKTTARLLWEEHRMKTAREIEALFSKYTDETSQAEMRHILPHAERYVMADDPMTVFRQLPFAKYGLPKEQLEALAKADSLSACGPILRALVQAERPRAMAAFINPEALERSIRHLMKTYPKRYPNGESFLKNLKALAANEETNIDALAQLRFRALVTENPLLKGKTILAVRRRDPGMKWKANWNGDVVANWQGLSSMGSRWRDKRSQIVTLSASEPEKEKILYKHKKWAGCLTLHFNAEKLLFTSLQAAKESAGNWNVYELGLKDQRVTSITGVMPDDTDSYDACYTATDGRVIFVNSSGYQGVPCVRGRDYVGNLHLLNRNANTVRRLCFDQDNNWSPTLLPNGRVLYTRWEYTDSAHYFSRVLMHMNPDGTDQKAFYGSNSYWPNSLFYAKPVPGSSSKFYGIVSGHHGTKQSGEVYLFDVQRGRRNAAGAVQQLPGYQKPVNAPIKDALVDKTRNRWIHPRPLSEQYILIAREGGGIYLMDVFDNIVPIKVSPNWSYYEPIVLEKTPKPREVPDRVRPEMKEAVAFVQDVYSGRAMKGVARGTVKALRVYRYEYSPRNAGGHYAMGMEAGWDVKIILGTTPVEPDGSAMFKVPANAPIALQPLDENGQALQQMRSWMTAMPGETISCIGCHESQNEAPPSSPAAAARKAPATLRPFYGQARGFGFMQEVQPVLDKHCIGCHDGTQKNSGAFTQPNFADVSPGPVPGYAACAKSYLALHPYVRRNGPEGDYTGLAPLEFHADTSLLIQLLKKGHHGVELPQEAMDRLVTWIDLNVPFHNSWNMSSNRSEPKMARRFELREKYAGIEANYEAPVSGFEYKRTETFVKPPSVPKGTPLVVKGYPLAKDDKRLAEAGKEKQTLTLAKGVALDIVKIPAGTFPMGSVRETPAEQPMTEATIAKPFWMGQTEISLAQYRAFDPEHRNGYYDMHYKDQVKPGYNMDADANAPAIRVSWNQAMAFCAWLSEKTGKKVTLPTEAQWEWAARAGTATPLFFGDKSANFAKVANLADVSIKKLAVHGVNPQPIKNPGPEWDFVPKTATVNDGMLHLASVDKYAPNGFGLKNMAGNVAEWTRSIYKPYPYKESDGRNAADVAGADRVIRGGSWRDRPQHATSSWRWRHPQWQRVYNVGFRIVVEE